MSHRPSVGKVAPGDKEFKADARSAAAFPLDASALASFGSATLLSGLRLAGSASLSTSLLGETVRDIMTARGASSSAKCHKFGRAAS